MKKFFIFLTALALLLLCGCGYSEASTEQEQGPDVIELVYRSDLADLGRWQIVRDTRTGVQYVCVVQAGICVMVNPDGTPYTGEVDK